MDAMNILLIILRLINLVLAVVPYGQKILAEYSTLRAMIEKTVAENRNPSIEEWKELDKKFEDLHEKAKRLNPTFPGEMQP